MFAEYLAAAMISVWVVIIGYLFSVRRREKRALSDSGTRL